MANEIRHEISSQVQPGTVELDPILLCLTFHSANELFAWQQGQPMKLINHWIREAPPPRYR